MGWLILWLVSVIGFIVVGKVGFLTFWIVIGWIGWMAFVTFLSIYYWLAPQNRWFTFVKEGTARIVIRSDAVIKILIQWKGYTFRYQIDKEVKGIEMWDVVEGNEPRHRFGGLRLYSFWHPVDDIYKYHQKWAHLHADGTIKEHDENLTFVFLKEDLYVIDLPLKEGGGVEDINGVPMGIKMVVPMRIFNPYIAIFRVRNWLSMTAGIIGPRLRQFVANYRYKEDLLNMRAGEGIEDIQKKIGVDDLTKLGDDLWDKFWKEVEKDFKDKGGEITDGGNGGKRIIRMYGVEIDEKGTRILEINPGPEYRRFTTMQYEAEREKERTIVTAEAEKRRLETVANGEKARIKTVYEAIQSFGDLGKLVRTLEAAEKSPLAASLTVQAIPGLQEVLRGVFGKPLEALSSQEFQELREMIEKSKGG